MYKDDYKYENDTLEIASEMGYLNIMKWLYSKRCKLISNVCTAAARNGNLENMKWLKANRCEWSLSVFWYSVKNGYNL